MFLANEATIVAGFILNRLPCLDLSYINGAALTLAFCVIFSAFLHFVVRRFAPGPARLTLASPLLITLLASPSIVFNASTHLSGTLVLSGLLMWWSTFKIFAFCLGRGPLAATVAESFIPFTFLAVLPVKLEEQGKAKVAPWYHSFGYFFAKAIGVFVSVALLDVVSEYPIAVHTLYIALLFLFVSVIMDLPAGVLSACNIPLSAHFNSPFLADSLEDFWSRRWNMTASALLRDAVYKPIVSLYFALTGPDSRSDSPSPVSDMEALKPVASRRSSPAWLKSLGVIATFAVSGLMHELILLHATRVVTWEWFWFFTIHGIGVVFEASVLRSINAPPIMLRIWLYAFCIYTLETLFWPPLIAAKFDERLLGEYRLTGSSASAITV